MKTQKVTPPANSKWKMWLGPEIEGTAHGEKTLFVREATDAEVLERPFLGSDSLKHVWLCKEFIKRRVDVTSDTAGPEQGKGLGIIKALLKKKCIISVELTDEVAALLNKKDINALREKGVTVFYKTAQTFPLRKGDFICAGPAYADEFFPAGTAKLRVKPADYRKDIKIA